MYNYNTDTQMWVKQTDVLSKDNYDNLKQDLQKLQLYSRALSGATYLYTSSTASIYDSLKYKDNSTWFVSPASSVYNSVTTLPIDGTPIDKNNLSLFDEYTTEYGFTLKNFFTPTKAINNLNIVNVSVATTGPIDLNSASFSQIDGIILEEGSLILVKDQKSTIDLVFSVNPDDYFDVNYYLISDNIADKTYEYYNSQNGIYKLSNGSLIKQEIATYSLATGLSVYVKIGETYGDKQFALSRKKSGFYPIQGEPIEFKESKNYLVRNQVDYHNLYESNYYDVLKHTTQNLTIEGQNYIIPERLLYIGEFGIILNLQSLTYSQYVFNPYKENLRSITQTSEYYWMCGDNGTILKMSKLDFTISKIDLNSEYRQFMSIAFIDDLNGIAVGKYNLIYYTKDGGWTWKNLNIGQSNWSFNRCLYYTYNLIFLAGENGLFGKLSWSDTTGFSFKQINLVKNLSLTDTYDLIQDINDMYYTHFDTYETGWGLTYATAVDLNAGNGITYSMDCLFMVTNNNNILCYEINNFVTEHGVLYLSFSQSLGDLTAITRQTGTNNMFVSGDDLYTFDINTFKYVSTTSNLITGTAFSIVSNDYSNRLFDFDGIDLYNVGNYALINDFNYASASYTPITNQTIVPKMLFMEYDMADKLNFFDADYNYRLPNSVTFSTTSLSNFTFNEVNNTWLSYTKDIWKTYAVNADTSSGQYVQMSLTFSSASASSLTFSNSFITINLNDVKGLYPNVGSLTASKWTSFSPIIPSTSYSVFMYRYISIFKLPNTFCNIGDILRIESNNIKENLLINYKVISGANSYFYAFTDFNGAILNSIKSSPILTITNLNKFVDSSAIVSNFENHPISEAYSLTLDSSIFTVAPRFNNYTAYKSLETNIDVLNTSLTNVSMVYRQTYNLFGYTPKYSLLNYLYNINSAFTASTKYYTMPEYSNLPCIGTGNFTSSNIYFDANQPVIGIASFPKNKLIFGSGLKYEFDTLWINTFVDLTLHTNLGNITKSRVLITNKYYDSTFGGWTLEFSDSIIKADDGFTYWNIILNSIDIISRNTLQEISDDLELFNNLNKPFISKTYNSGSWFFDFYDNPIKTKINTDSYTKILLSDRDIKKYLSSIIYTNSDNILSLNVMNVPSLEEVTINNTFQVGTQLALNTSGLDKLDDNLLGFINFTGGTGSSEEINRSYIGINSLTKLDNYDFIVSTDYLNTPSVTDTGIVKINKFDPFFNYSPINLYEVTDNKKFKIPTLLSPNNLVYSGTTYSLVGNITTPTFRLVDSLDIDTIVQNFHWILEAEVQDAIIGQDSTGIVWYKGLWQTGRWFGSKWYSGVWLSGDWYNGNWFSYEVIDKITSVTVGQSNFNNTNSVWYNGRWFDGNWQSGTWLNGRWYNGNWTIGNWYNGVWNDGNWSSGLFTGGVWIRGNWKSGTFNSFNKPAYWLDGSFYSGDFQNGMWYNGIFGLEVNSVNKFGSSASNSRNAIWQGGVWSSGNFYSSETLIGGTPSTSPIHKFSQFRTGSFNSGNFYGGIVYNIELNGGNWYSGVVLDIEIIGVNLSTNVITLNGLFRFNINDYVNILEDGSYTPYLGLGNYNSPGRYRVALVEYDYTKEWTFLTLNYNLNTLGVTGTYSATASYNIDTGIRLVSKFKNIDWNGGVWTNGIYDGGTFLGGMWYNGVFNGTWGI